MKLTLTLILYLAIVTTLYSQSNSDFDFFAPPQKTSITETDNYSTTKKVSPDKNEIKVAGELLIYIYRNLLSSQDGSVCRFYPTCSAYCVHALSKNGPIKGGIQTLDRLTRCNGLSPEKYQIDIERRRLLDPVK